MARHVFSLDLREPSRRRILVRWTAFVEDLAPRDGRVEVYLPAWTPGSYLIREYAKHLGDVTALDESGNLLPLRKVRKNRFEVEVGDRPRLEIRYWIYAHELSVRTSDLTEAHAFITGAASFLWAVDGPRDLPVRVELLVPPTWDVQTSMPTEQRDPGTFDLTARGIDDLVDSPILAGQLEVLPFEALGKPHHFVLDGLDGLRPPDSLVPDTIAILEQAAAIFGSTVPYDEYKFLCMFAGSGRGGLEHLASTALLAPRTTFHPRRSYEDFMGLVAHEYFHVWNVKRMRPVDLWDFDYEVENYTSLLWVAEGFTAYFDDHLCRRAGILTTKRYLEIVGEGITNLHRTPGRHHQSLSESSYDAWIRLYRPDEDTRNATLSYYGNGALAAMCLDLTIRAATDGARSLDDAVRSLYEQTFEKDRGYDAADVVEAVSAAAGRDMAAEIHGLTERTLDPDFDAVLAPVGLRLESKSSDQLFLGIQFKGGTTTLSTVFEHGAADRAGLMPGDELLALNGLRVKSGSWAEVFDQSAASEQGLRVLLSRRGRILNIDVHPETRAPSVKVVSVDSPTEDQLRLRRAWLFDPQA